MSKETVRKCDVCDLELEVIGTMRSFIRQRFTYNTIAKIELTTFGYVGGEIVNEGDMCIDCYKDYQAFVKKKRKAK